MLAKMFKDILTGIDNETYDHSRVVGLGCLVGYFIVGFVNMIHANQIWSAIDFASGISAITIAFGIQIKLKENTEPPRN
jgi:hypothetical protein